MIQAENISKGFAGHTLFQNLSLVVDEESRIALVGPNGCGKTTLIKILLDLESPDRGRLIQSRDTRIGYLPQEISAHFSGGSVFDEVRKALPEVLALEKEIEELYGAGDHGAGGARLAEAQEYYRLHDGYGTDARVKKVLAGLGFAEGDVARPVEELSGGYRMRVLIARLLLGDADILILDEPTNHLDLETLAFFEEFLKNCRKGYLIVSHDRYFLDKMVDRVVELERGVVTTYTGNYTQYREQREDRLDHLKAAKRRQDDYIRHQQRFIDRNRVRKDRAKAVKGRMKLLEKVERIEIPEREKTIHFFFPGAPRGGDRVLTLRGVSKRYGERVIYHNLDFEVLRGDRIALVGPNGSGKSTLLKMAAGVLAPEGGERVLGSNVNLEYYSQFQMETLIETNTLLEEMYRGNVARLPEQVLRSILGSFGVTGDRVKNSVATLSGGERARLALARMLLRPTNFLLLDEPTGHLDPDSLDVLEMALGEFEGAILFISHDRYFINRQANKVAEVKDGGVQISSGGYDDYVRLKKRAEEIAVTASADRRRPERVEKPKPAAEAGAAERKDEKRKQREDERLRRQKEVEEQNRKARERRKLDAEIGALEKLIHEKEEELKSLHAVMADPATARNGLDWATLARRAKELGAEIEVDTHRWGKLAERREAIARGSSAPAPPG